MLVAIGAPAARPNSSQVGQWARRPSGPIQSVGDWGSARAAAGESLFLLADFEAVIEGDPGQAPSDESDAEEDKGYQPVETNFAPGYFMAGLASAAMEGDLPKTTEDDGFLL